MNAQEFWHHIKATRRRDTDAHAERLARRLAKLPEAEILDFVRLWDVMDARAYSWNLWGAAYLINGGASDDGFQYFCWWLIMQGEAVFEAAVLNPDTLAAVLDGEEGMEAEVDPGADAWFLKTGTPRTDAGYDAYGRAVHAHHTGTPRPDLGDQWDHDSDAEVRARFPRLADMYLDAEDD